MPAEIMFIFLKTYETEALKTINNVYVPQNSHNAMSSCRVLTIQHLTILGPNLLLLIVAKAELYTVTWVKLSVSLNANT